jgi:hypothetical protein
MGSVKPHCLHRRDARRPDPQAPPPRTQSPSLSQNPARSNAQSSDPHWGQGRPSPSKTVTARARPRPRMEPMMPPVKESRG